VGGEGHAVRQRQRLQLHADAGEFRARLPSYSPIHLPSVADCVPARVRTQMVGTILVSFTAFVTLVSMSISSSGASSKKAALAATDAAESAKEA
jgi:hypothetical protein